MNKIDQIMTALPADRPKIRLRPKLRGNYKRRPRMSRDELITYLKENGMRSVGQLLKSRGKDDPIPWDYRREFGSWSKAIEVAWGTPPHDPFAVKRPTHAYLVKCCNDLNIWRRDDWLAARRRDPAIVPSIWWVRRLWGRFDNLRWQAEKENFKFMMEGYVRLQMIHGRAPTNDELRRAGIPMEAMRKVFDDKHDMDRVLKTLPRAAMAYIMSHSTMCVRPTVSSAPAAENMAITQDVPVMPQS
jgi:hypothetical protein